MTLKTDSPTSISSKGAFASHISEAHCSFNSNHNGDPEHLVQFYENDNYLAESVCEFLAEALEQGDGAVALATRIHRNSIEKALIARGVDLSACQDRGQYLLLDAADTLSQIMNGGFPDPNLFFEKIGKPIEAVARKWPHVRAYGELVTLLWDEGKQDATCRLEELWNELIQQLGFSLLCSYPIRSFEGVGDEPYFAEVCSCHSRVIPAESYSALQTNEAQRREISALQQKAKALEIQILERKKVEQELSDFLENSLEGLHKVDSEGIILWVNQAELDLLGYERDEYVGHSITEFHADQNVIQEIISQLKNGENILNRHARLICKDGTLKEVLIHSNGYYENGDLVYTRCFTRDVTEKKQAERDRALLAAIVESSEDAILSEDLNGIITSWNSGAEKLFGYAAHEAIGKSIHMLMPEDSKNEEFRILDRIRQGERIASYETIRRHKGGALIDISLTVSPIINENGQVIGASKVDRDITEQVEIRKKLDLARHEAEKANEAKSAFLANISHELRTPMTAVLGFTEMLRSESSAPEYLEKLDTISRNGKYLLSILDDILDLSRIELGKVTVSHQSVDVCRLIEDVESLMGVRADAEGIPLRVEWKSDIPKRITADRVRTRQILVNLISNALKFTNEGEVKLQIGLSHNESGANIEFSVVDSGIGMTAEQQRIIFQPFTQASPETARRYGGTGLGLSISKRLAQAMSGKIAFESEVGKGSCFTLTLPVSKRELTKLVRDPGRRVSGKKPTNGNGTLPKIKAKILLADDRRDVWRVCKFFLEKCGAKVTVVEDGRQAVDVTLSASRTEEPYELVLMDMQMPIMSGREAVQEIRAKGIKIPIIALTADAMEGEREACLEIGCSEYFAKPINGSKLMKLVASLLSNAC